MRAKTKRAREMASFSWRGVARCDAVRHGGVAAAGARACFWVTIASARTTGVFGGAIASACVNVCAIRRLTGTSRDVAHWY